MAKDKINYFALNHLNGSFKKTSGKMASDSEVVEFLIVMPIDNNNNKNKKQLKVQVFWFFWIFNEEKKLHALRTTIELKVCIVYIA